MRLEQNSDDETREAPTGSNHECTVNVKSEKERLKTFMNWPAKQVDPLSLVKLGFFYKQYGDEIQCAFCGMQLSNWCPNSDPHTHHQIYSHGCDFIQNRECGNIPL